jgi:hypothetical protein
VREPVLLRFQERFTMNRHDENDTGSFEGGEFVSSSRRRSRGKWGKSGKRFTGYQHEVTADDSMFTAYRIDGFPQPFGGFVFAGADQQLVGKAADAPVVRVKKMPVKDPPARTTTGVSFPAPPQSQAVPTPQASLIIT